MVSQSNPQYAEKIRANFFDVEKRVEQGLRDAAGRLKAALPRNEARLEADRSGVDKCILYFEGELARLSPADRAAPDYASLQTLTLKQPSQEPYCSDVVDTDFPGATRIVTEKPDYYDPALPPSAIQLILVDFSNLEGAIRADPPWRPAVFERTRDNLDYSSLTAMLQLVRNSRPATAARLLGGCPAPPRIFRNKSLPPRKLPGPCFQEKGLPPSIPDTLRRFFLDDRQLPAQLSRYG